MTAPNVPEPAQVGGDGRCATHLPRTPLDERMVGCDLPLDHDGEHEAAWEIPSLIKGSPPAVCRVRWSLSRGGTDG